MKGLQCDTCDKLCHIKCNSMSVEEYGYFQTSNDDESIKWHCAYCTMKFFHENIAFTLVETSEIEKINNSDSMKFCSGTDNIWLN